MHKHLNNYTYIHIYTHFPHAFPSKIWTYPYTITNHASPTASVWTSRRSHRVARSTAMGPEPRPQPGEGNGWWRVVEWGCGVRVELEWICCGFVVNLWWFFRWMTAWMDLWWIHGGRVSREWGWLSWWYTVHDRIIFSADGRGELMVNLWWINDWRMLRGLWRVEWEVIGGFIVDKWLYDFWMVHWGVIDGCWMRKEWFMVYCYGLARGWIMLIHG